VDVACSQIASVRASPTPMADLHRQEIEALYVRYGPYVSRRCRYLLRDPEAARDAAQEVFVKVLRAYGQFRGETSPLGWVLKIATHHCLNVIASRDAAWRERYLNQQAAEPPEPAGQPLEAMIRAQEVRRLLAKLDPETQQIAVHYYVDEMTQEEIGQVLDRSLPTIRKRLAKLHRVAERELGHELS
jgi:RNA polymerase sigma factor (sigma-70 family)